MMWHSVSMYVTSLHAAYVMQHPSYTRVLRHAADNYVVHKVFSVMLVRSAPVLEMFHAKGEEDLWSLSLESRAREGLHTCCSLTHFLRVKQNNNK